MPDEADEARAADAANAGRVTPDSSTSSRTSKARSAGQTEERRVVIAYGEGTFRSGWAKRPWMCGKNQVFSMSKK